MRIEAQYYVTAALRMTLVEENAKGAREFVLTLEETIEKMTEEQINSIRKRIKELITINKRGGHAIQGHGC